MTFLLYIQINIEIKNTKENNFNTFSPSAFMGENEIQKSEVRKSVYFEHDPDGTIHPKPF